jgi:hypothetical protein
MEDKAVHRQRMDIRALTIPPIASDLVPFMAVISGSVNHRKWQAAKNLVTTVVRKKHYSRTFAPSETAFAYREMNPCNAKAARCQFGRERRAIVVDVSRL